MTLETWVAMHPYLRRMTDLQNMVDASAAEVLIPAASVPMWSAYLFDFHAGVPLLRSADAMIDVQPAAKAFASFVETLASKPLPAKLNYETSDLLTHLQSDVSFAERGIDWIIEKTNPIPKNPGLLYYLGWTVLARYLQQLNLAFVDWRDEECWLRNYCPMCGALPTMGQLVGEDSAGIRLLSCSRCASRWRYRRIGCPFCETADDTLLAFLAIEGEPALRIDCCETCVGYIKTYKGKGDESVLLADWTSLHLDVIAQDRGLRRYGSSLFNYKYGTLKQFSSTDGW